MSRAASDYIAVALLSNLSWEPEDERYDSDRFGFARGFSGDLDKLRQHAEQKVGFPVDGQTLEQAVRVLADCGLLRITDDAYAGRYVKIFEDRISKFVENAHKQITESQESIHALPNRADHPLGYALLQHDIIDDYHELGDEWLSRALQGLRRFQNDNGRLPSAGESLSTLIPASDRFVTLTQNQSAELDQTTTELIEELEKENAVDGDPSARAWMLGQLRAVRELFRAQVLNAWLAQALIMDVLRGLKSKYEGHVIGATAATLIELLIKNGVGSN